MDILKGGLMTPTETKSVFQKFPTGLFLRPDTMQKR